jgi:subtilisin family serine protease
MELQQYIVTLHVKDDLEEFYHDMEHTCSKKHVPERVCDVHSRRPLSRNTHYKLLAHEAEMLRHDERVLAVELHPCEIEGVIVKPCIVNNTPRTISGDFAKTSSNPNYRQWGHLHSAGSDAQRRKGSWSSGVINDSVVVFNDGKHVDVVVCDDPIPYNCEEWNSPTTGQTRFQQYQWFNELNQYVAGLDDDSVTLPTGTITYPDNSTTTGYHGAHVTGTVAGQYYGWASEANIYSLQTLGAGGVDPMVLFDYLRAFHLNKPINPETGTRNPTITNHSWGYGYNMMNWYPAGYTVDNIQYIVHRGVTYDINNPNPSGWTTSGVHTDFGLMHWWNTIPASIESLRADINDAVLDGVVVVGAAGNDNYLMDVEGGPDWNNYVKFDQLNGIIYYNRGSSPTNARVAIRVGALSIQSDFRRTSFTNFGPAVHLFAPGDNILSSITNPGTNGGRGSVDTKYSANNWYASLDGTSMASPQVAGVCALIASGNHKFAVDDVLNYLQQQCKFDDMAFDLGDGTHDDNTCSKGSPNLHLLSVNPRKQSGQMMLTVGSRYNSLRPATDTFQSWPRPGIFKSQGERVPFVFTESGPLYGSSIIWDQPIGDTAWSQGTWGDVDNTFSGTVVWGVTENLVWDGAPDISLDPAEINWDDQDQTDNIIWGTQQTDNLNWSKTSWDDVDIESWEDMIKQWGYKDWTEFNDHQWNLGSTKWSE